MSSVYHGRRLNVGEIRLVELLPGRWPDQVRCQLLYDFLRNKPPYQALSYVWGSQKINRPILLDGRIHPVTVNLESALLRLRHADKPMIFWIDALCINQADIDERARQVESMGQIFRTATKVIAYLGDGCDRAGVLRRRRPIHFFGDDRDVSKLDASILEIRKQSPTSPKPHAVKDSSFAFEAFCLVRTLADEKHVINNPLFAGQTDSEAENSRLLALFEALRRFMHAPWTPWWDRIWVVQEIVLASEVTVVCGMMSAPWEMFARAAMNYTDHAHTCCSKAVERLPRDYSTVLADFSQRVRDIEELRAAYCAPASTSRKISRSENSGALGAAEHKRELMRRSLLALLRRFRPRKATDPRDKVYALLSLALNEDNQFLAPDYSLSESEVFCRTAIESIKSTGSLSVLMADLGRKFRRDLPSWVPDWDAPEDHARRAWIEAVELYDASGGMRAELSDKYTPKASKVLPLTARCMGDVTTVGPIMWADSIESSRDTLEGWFDMRTDRGSSQTVVSHRQPPLPMSWNVFCADILYSPSENTSLPRFSRTDAGHELMFVTWALESERSPFRKTKGGDLLLPEIISEGAMQWKTLLELERSILRNDLQMAMCHLKKLLPAEAEYKEVVGQALRDRPLFRGRPRESMLRSLIAFSDDEKTLDRLRVELDGSELGSSVGENMKEIEGQNMPDKATSIAQLQRLKLAAIRELPWQTLYDIIRTRVIERHHLNVAILDTIHSKLQISLIDTSIMSASLNRRMFRTAPGHIGLGPATMQPGDSLWVIQGGRTPFILRREKQTPISYELIGDYYAHGLIDSSSEDVVKWAPINLV